MLFTITLTSVLASLAFANPDPQTPAQTTEAVQEYQSYAAALQTDPVLLSLASVYATDPAGRESFLSAENYIYSAYEAGEPVGASDFTAFPTNVQSVLQSVASEVNAIGTLNGFSSGAVIPTRTNAPIPTGTSAVVSASPNAASSRNMVGVGAAVVGGFVAVVAAL